jgi:hypothetical protein
MQFLLASLYWKLCANRRTIFDQHTGNNYPSITWLFISTDICVVHVECSLTNEEEVRQSPDDKCRPLLILNFWFQEVLVGIFVYFRPELISIVFFKTHCSRTHRDVYFYTALSISPAYDYSEASQPLWNSLQNFQYKFKCKRVCSHFHTCSRIPTLPIASNVPLPSD